MGFLANCEAINYDTKGSAPGKAIILTTSAGADQERTSELYHPPGISSAPAVNDSIVEALIGSGKRVSIASHNYQLEIEVSAGEIKIFSTNSDGSEVKSLIYLDVDGKITHSADGDIELTSEGNITLNGDDKSLVTHAELDSALQNMVSLIMTHVHTSASSGSPTTTPTSSISVDISAAETTTIKTGG